MFHPYYVDILNIYKRQKEYLNLNIPVFVEAYTYSIDTIEQFEEIRKSLMDTFSIIKDIKPCLHGTVSRTTPPIELIVWFKEN